MSKKNKIFLIAFLVSLVVSFLTFRYIYKDHRDISSEEACYELTLDKIEASYNTNSEEANKKFLDKTIKVKGNITQIDTENKYLIVDNKISCSFNTIENAELNSEVTIKGRFIGYDELLEEFKLDECSIIK